MGRLRIKKKEAVLPFRETVAFRFILVAISFVFFMIAASQIIRGAMNGNSRLLIISIVLGIGTAGLTLFNLSQMSRAKVPRSAQKRLKRARR
jgi:hypothetical protein